MANSATTIVQQALARFGSDYSKITDLATDQSVQGVQARLVYDQTRQGVLRSFQWGFAEKRVALVADTGTPAYGYSAQFVLPDDFLRLVEVHHGGRFSLEGGMILTSDSACSIKYVQDVTDVTRWDALFTEVMILSLATKLSLSLAQDKNLYGEMSNELNGAIARCRTIDAQERELGKHRMSWNDSRFVAPRPGVR